MQTTESLHNTEESIDRHERGKSPRSSILRSSYDVPTLRQALAYALVSDDARHGL